MYALYRRRLCALRAQPPTDMRMMGDRDPATVVHLSINSAQRPGKTTHPYCVQLSKAGLVLVRKHCHLAAPALFSDKLEPLLLARRPQLF